MDVSGHGAGAAMHSVAVMNLLRQRAVPGADLADPGQVLAALNDMFQMEDHAGLYFTMWYGVFDPATRRLDFASAGHHAAYLKPAGGGDLVPLRARGGLIGALPGRRYTADSATAPPGASLYLFSDGVFEIVTVDGLQWTLTDFLPLISGAAAEGAGACQRIFEAVGGLARPGGLDDDFSLVKLTFA
jgi:serine phosphatase RsbU (regulator of sigma subunit)